MVIIGELINTSRKSISEAVDKRDAAYIKKVAIEQMQAGATYIDVNCGNKVHNEVEIMEWLVKNIQAAVDIPLCIDSPNPQALEAGLSLARTGQPLINSITDEKVRYEAVLPLVLKYKAKVIALCMDDTGMPNTAGDRMRVVSSLYKKLTSAGVAEENIHFDPLVKPISVVSQAGVEVLETIKWIKQDYPNVHFACGLSNVSFGLPGRKVLNRLFVVQTMALGMDGYILNPTDKGMMGFIQAGRTLLGQDEYCGDYLTAYRNGYYD
ncbi:methyltetrahydrofolate cobalamin methyltransferase [Sporomusa acidovorans]|uniref:5-methyltetrahydrofolate:corrinoid/iron-sulfur protein co-methyltransferase n=1 Tax=Sporomusa acidovorans (strain ATCC 49682 / DSM 3132 / Mol) TaxID=1123286 RepID=A0ABZ3J8N8_SPOA4|nr:methyltetrahydrofolate cobalamin methyltransferase [Sporomusa acidovorans]OZC16712.1 5-methyltetrahydrofolate:corrinoid/iron-sulfur protein co-methyltransferase [Sporomusa acidovorans DSM 3132]SDE05046.1 5-methyltetrahydrofolate--homocysteine methyltransferase [Sporomusa acidovorans]